ncbi:MAG TPA: VOC family protein [Candidatus Saccharimonadales bacterium]|nr:VOC family protein [Candidatus Saccharimonadales bacterium]
MDMLLEVVVVPVSDVDAAKEFYEHKLGFKVDMDVAPNKGMRLVQLTPQGSQCSIHIGEGITEMKPGSIKGLILVVDSAEAAKHELKERGVDTDPIQDFPWGKHLIVTDPDGNTLTLQESYARKKRDASQDKA